MLTDDDRLRYRSTGAARCVKSPVLLMMAAVPASVTVCGCDADDVHADG